MKYVLKMTERACQYFFFETTVETVFCTYGIKNFISTDRQEMNLNLIVSSSLSRHLNKQICGRPRLKYKANINTQLKIIRTTRRDVISCYWHQKQNCWYRKDWTSNRVSEWVNARVCNRTEISKNIYYKLILGCDKQQYELYGTPTMPRAP